MRDTLYLSTAELDEKGVRAIWPGEASSLNHFSTTGLTSTHLRFRHHVFIRLQVEGKGLPHLSEAVEEHLHLHHVRFIPLSELNIWKKKNPTQTQQSSLKRQFVNPTKAEDDQTLLPSPCSNPTLARR